MSAEPESLRGYLTADQGTTPTGAVRPSSPAIDDVVETEPTEFDPGDVKLTKALPANVAMLCVTGTSVDGQPSFVLNFHYRGGVRTAARPSDLADQRPPDLALATLAERTRGQGTPWQDAYWECMNWADTKHKLVTWIRDLLAAPDAPRLVVWDNTDYEIPWELYYHRPSGGAEGAGWLGELIPVIRWTAVHDGARAWQFSARKRECVGGLLMFEDPKMGVEPDGFARYELEARARTMRELMRRLDRPCQPFGLLVIRCHGEYSRDTRKFKLGGLPLNAYTEFTMHALQQSGALVLLNACVSGRPVVDERHPSTATRSFAEVFLRYGAGGVIATAGDVDLNHSHDFAVRLLSDANSRPVNVAEALREHRKHYANRVRYRPGAADNRTEQQFKDFFASFMYLYFGHPDTILRTGDTP
ncbi:CHAT domain-containing protein [Actinocrispum wychmicini]|uniref:CHAT domain-containing protein n=1 Tax=Actinocrispum wychmicini TaxID=1213861 RepID=A0A4R2JIW9_9PSEU|nr:CHAT domain-containing protein [Actinocrispum wychmicini]TCO59851.1 CHAT domain-containing protein [Actinocrispum wychmicini]